MPAAIVRSYVVSQRWATDCRCRRDLRLGSRLLHCSRGDPQRMDQPGRRPVAHRLQLVEQRAARCELQPGDTHQHRLQDSLNRCGDRSGQSHDPEADTLESFRCEHAGTGRSKHEPAAAIAADADRGRRRRAPCHQFDDQFGWEPGWHAERVGRHSDAGRRLSGLQHDNRGQASESPAAPRPR